MALLLFFQLRLLKTYLSGHFDHGAVGHLVLTPGTTHPRVWKATQEAWLLEWALEVEHMDSF